MINPSCVKGLSLASRLAVRKHVHLSRAQPPRLLAIYTPPRRWYSKPRSALAILGSRGHIKAVAGDRAALDNVLTRCQTGAYTGVDPTAPSLHLGHLIPLMLLFWLHALGHNITMLVGGGTARIGDPAGRLSARTHQTTSLIEDNALSIRAQLQKLSASAKRLADRHNTGSSDTTARCVVDDNYRYLGKLGIIDFLGVAGIVARVGTMLGRDTVRTRLAKDGMSFAEFSYPLLQAYDWWHLYRESGVQIQIGGSDQYGNIIAGQDLIKALAKDDAETGAGPPIGLTTPLLTTSSGEKFGKSAGNAVWLDPESTSPFKLYGHLVGTSDADVERYLRLLTFVPNETIQRIMQEHAHRPGERKAQHLLAREVCDLAHGEDVAAETLRQHREMRDPSSVSVDSSQNSRPAPAMTILRSQLDKPMAKLLVEIGFAKTNGEGARMISSGGIYTAHATGSADGPLNFEAVPAAQEPGSKYVIAGRDVLIVRKGKWDVRSIAIVDDPVF